MNPTTHRIEVRYSSECPSHPEALAVLRDVLDERIAEVELELRELHTEEEAHELGFPGSPTILVDGVDVDAAGASARPTLSCRVYRFPDGRVSPIPSRAQIEEALR